MSLGLRLRYGFEFFFSLLEATVFAQFLRQPQACSVQIWITIDAAR